MTSTFLGSAVATVSIFGNNQLIQNLFTIENGTASRVNIILRRLTVQIDPTGLLTTVMPVVRTVRASAIGFTGGIILPKVPFDTNLSSDNNVVIRTSFQSSVPIIGSGEGIINWGQYASRLHTGEGQISTSDDTIVPNLSRFTDNRFIITPGQALLVQADSNTILSNDINANNWNLQCVWEEESIPTFPISGKVTLGGVPLNGAKIIIIESPDEFMSTPTLLDIQKIGRAHV